MLLGDSRVEPSSEFSSSHVASAFRYRARATGAVGTAEVYVAVGSSARELVVGLYSDRSHLPHRLLTAGRLSSPKSRAWNRVTLRPASVKAAREYWIAIMGIGGRLGYRDTKTPVARCERSVRLTTMPAAYRSKGSCQAIRASAFIGRAAGSTLSSPTGSTGAPGNGTGQTNPPNASPQPGGSGVTQTSNCLPTPSACGYPDGTNSGIAGCPALTPSGGFTASTPGATYSNMDISGEVMVTAPNVTFNCVRIKDNNPSGNHGYVLDSEGSNTMVEHTEVDGQSGNQDSCVQGDSVTLNYVNIHGCVDGMHVGWNVTVENSWIHGNTTSIPSPHMDGLQWIGCSSCSGAPANWNDLVEHNTIFPGNGASAPWTNSAVFIQAADGPVSGVTVDNNLLDGGGYTAFVNSQNGYPTPSNIALTNNRFGTNAHFGATEFQSPGPLFTGNVWDASGRPCPADPRLAVERRALTTASRGQQQLAELPIVAFRCHDQTTLRRGFHTPW